MSYAYYPGCSLHSTGSEYDISIKYIFNSLGISYEEIKDWNCCGTTPAHCTSKYLSVALPVRNLKLVEDSGKNKVAVPCASCFSRLKRAKYEISKDEDLKKKVDDILQTTYGNTVTISHPLDIIKNEIGLKSVREKMKRSLSGLKVACYYGCLMTRPPDVTEFDECEYPVIMDEILTELGADVKDWSYKTDCCGASFSISRTESSVKLMEKVIRNAVECGAECIAVACPLCHANLDTRQEDINIKYNGSFNVPIFYFSELMAIAFGAKDHELGLKKHITDPSGLLTRYKLA